MAITIYPDGKIIDSNGKNINQALMMVDQWRRTATLNTSAAENFITSDWERVDNSGQGTLGTGMSESGGIFTFPTTGIYSVSWQAYAEDSTGSATNAVNVYLTTDNSTYTNTASGLQSVTDSAGSGTYEYGFMRAETLVDVTDTSLVKVKFRVYSSGGVAWDISSSENRNCATFIRLGDT